MVNRVTKKFLTLIIFTTHFSSFCHTFQPGPYIGGTLNTQNINEKITSDEAFSGSLDVKGQHSAGASVLFGTDFVHGNFVYGMAVDVGICNASTKFNFTNNSNDTIYARGKLSSLSHAKIRFGYGSGDLLPYIGLGIAVSSFHHEAPDNNLSTRDLAVGPSLSAGIEYAFSPAIRVLGEVTYDMFSTLSAGLGVDSFYAKPTVTSFKIGMVYKIPPPSNSSQPIASISADKRIVEIRFRPA